MRWLAIVSSAIGSDLYFTVLSMRYNVHDWKKNIVESLYDRTRLSTGGRIAALERLVGKQALEIEFLKGALKHGPRPEARLHPSSPAPRHLRRRRMPDDGDRTLDLLR